MRNIWYLNAIGSQTNAESCLESQCLERALRDGIGRCPLVLAVETGCDQHKAIENFLYARGEYHLSLDAWELTTAPSPPGIWRFMERLTAFLAEQGLFVERPDDRMHSEAELWEEFLRQFLRMDRAPNMYIVLERFTLDNPLFNDFLWKLGRYTGRWLHFILLMNRPLRGLSLPLIQQATCITYAQFLMTEEDAAACLANSGIAVREDELRTIWHVTDGWALPSDLLLRKAERDPSVLEDIKKEPIGTIQYLPELRVFFQETLLDRMDAQEQELLLKSAVDNHLSDDLLRFLEVAEGSASIEGIAEKCPYIACIRTFERVYAVNPVVQSYLYHTARQRLGKAAVAQLHARAAEYFAEKQDWKRVLSHNLQQGKLKEAAHTFRHLAFSQISSFLLEGFKELVRRSPISLLENAPWVQFAYALSVKCQYPNISIQYFDKALRGFRQAKDTEGEILAFCQKVGLGFFSPSHKSEVLECEMLDRFFTPPGTAMTEDAVLDSYRKIFLAYAYIQLNTRQGEAEAMLEEAEQTSVILQEKNIRLWVDFVRILYYSNRPDSMQLKRFVTEALELSEDESLQTELKMYLYQTAGFVYFIKSGLYEPARRYCERARRLAQELGVTSYLVYINLIYSYALDCLREFDLAEQIILETENISRNILNLRNEHLWAYYLIGQSYHYYLKGEDEQAAFYAADNAIRLSRKSKRNSYLARALLVMSSIRMERGELAQAQAHITECLELTTAENYYFYHVSAEYQQALLYRETGRRDLFGRELRSLLDGTCRTGVYHFNFTRPWTLARAVEDAGIDPQSSQYLRDLCERNSAMTRDGGPLCGFAREEREFRFLLLGSFRCYRRKTPIPLNASRKVGYLLEMLAAFEEPVGVSRIIDELWPNQSQKQAMNNFYYTLHQLRRALDSKELVRYEGKACWLDQGLFSTDVQEFRHWSKRGEAVLERDGLAACEACFDRALALYRGPFLEEEALERHLSLERSAVEQQVYRVCRDYGAALLRGGRCKKAVEVLRRAARNEFAQEELFRLLMIAYHMAGDRKEALELYQTLEQKLLSEMDAAPHPLTRQLCEAIKNGEDTRQYLS